MTQEIRLCSARDIIVQIFGHCPQDEQEHYYKRLLNRYADGKIRDHLPEASYTDSHNTNDEGIVYSNRPNNLIFWENVLRLDNLLKQPTHVLNALKAANEGKLNELRSAVEGRREELKNLLSPLESVLAESSNWIKIPDNFAPDEIRLSELIAPKTEYTQSPATESWKANIVEKIIEVEATQAWQSGEPSATAQKANLYIKIGAYALAHQQVEAGLVDHPDDPALHFVKAQLLLSESAQFRWKSFTHQVLHQEAAPLSAEEAHHEEQAFDQAETAHNKKEGALIQLMASYRYWDEAKLPNWAYPRSQKIHEQVFFKIIELADYSAKAIHEQRNWLKAQLSEQIEEQDSLLSRDIIHFFTKKGCILESHVKSLYCPKNFSTLLRYWSLMQRVKPITYRKSVKAWRKAVDASYTVKPNSLSTWQWFKLNEVDIIQAEVSWSNPWPELINEASTTESFSQAMTDAKVPVSFFKKADKTLAEQQADRRLWQRIVYGWRGLSRVLETQSGDSTKACQKAYKSLAWNKSAFSNTWKTRWLYALARSHFDETIRAWPDRAKALKSLDEVEKLRRQHPEIEQAGNSLLTVHQPSDEEDCSHPCDMLGHYAHIFTDTDTEMITRTWGAFSTYHPLSHELERPLPLERHYAFAEACQNLEGSLYNKVRQLVSPR